MALDIEIFVLFTATWAMNVPLYYYLGEIRKNIGCPICKKAIAEKELRDAKAEGA